MLWSGPRGSACAIRWVSLRRPDLDRKVGWRFGFETVSQKESIERSPSLRLRQPLKSLLKRRPQAREPERMRRVRVRLNFVVCFIPTMISHQLFPSRN